MAEPAPVGGAQARLLLQLALGAVQRILRHAVQLAGRYLPGKGIQRHAVLAHQCHHALRVHGHNGRGPLVDHHLARGLPAVGQADPPFFHPDDLAVIYRFAVLINLSEAVIADHSMSSFA